jgi:hypothetical protein
MHFCRNNSKSAPFRISSPLAGLLVLRFPSKSAMTRAVLRYEILETYRTLFKLKAEMSRLELKQAVRLHKPDFRMHWNWIQGYSLSGRTFVEVFKTGRLTKLDKQLQSRLALATSNLAKTELIVTCDEYHKAVLPHEMSHFLFETNPFYKTEVQELLNQYDLKPFYTSLTKLGYPKHLLLEEVNAFFLTYSIEAVYADFGLRLTSDVKKAHNTLRLKVWKLFLKYKRNAA